ncbi:MAG TPA: hypothetical protein PKC41_08075 [Chitinophagaceae bacterium]|nr:hypothetical protein [Chitinophagaceae bacterium]HQW45503.1 hypothetical protein [Chitinophagaceae bacterium]
MVFTLLYLELEPFLSQTISSSNIRINQIKQYIRSCKFGIHDLSRNKAMKDGELPRFNMPYELGLDIGASEYGNKTLRKKKILIIDTERYHYQKVLSDIAGQDISNHNDDPKMLVKKVRNWISTSTASIAIAPHSEIWAAFNQFTDDLTSTLLPDYTPEDIDEMTIGDYIKFAKDWLSRFKKN